MRILQVIPSLELGGAEKVVEQLSKQIQKSADHKVMVVSLYPLDTPIVQELIDNGVSVQLLDKKPGLDFSTVSKLRRIVKDFEPNVVHAHLYALLYTALATLGMRQVKKLYTVHSLAEKEVGKLYRKFYAFCFHRLGFLPVAISEAIQNSVVNEYRLSKELVKVIPNGIEIEAFPKKTNYSIHDKCKLLHVGSFKEAKNHPFLIRAFHQIQTEVPAELYLVGDGPLRKDIERMVRDLRLEQSVYFVGELSDVRPQLLNADVFLLPSAWEGLPISVIEAMAVGLPIVATRVGGLASLITNGEEGVLTEVEEASFVREVINLLRNQTLRESLGECAKIKAQQFSAHEMALKYLDVYQEII